MPSSAGNLGHAANTHFHVQEKQDYLALSQCLTIRNDWQKPKLLNMSLNIHNDVALNFMASKHYHLLSSFINITLCNKEGESYNSRAYKGIASFYGMKERKQVDANHVPPTTCSSDVHPMEFVQGIDLLKSNY